MTDDPCRPESKRAEQLIDARLPGRDALDELVIVRSGELRVTNPEFREQVRGLVQSYLRSWLEWLPHVEIEDPAFSPAAPTRAKAAGTGLEPHPAVGP